MWSGRRVALSFRLDTGAEWVGKHPPPRIPGIPHIRPEAHRAISPGDAIRGSLTDPVASDYDGHDACAVCFGVAALEHGMEMEVGSHPGGP